MPAGLLHHILCVLAQDMIQDCVRPFLLLLLLSLAATTCDEPTRVPSGVRERWYQPQAGYGSVRPAVVGDLVLFGTGDTRVIARDRKTGAERWSTRVTQVAMTPGTAWANIVVRRGAAVVPLVRNTVALDVATGRELWSYSAPLDTLEGQPPIPGSVDLARLDADSSTVFIPAAGATVSALDIRTGAVRWVWRVDPALPFRSEAQGVRLSGDTLFVSGWHFLDQRGLRSEVRVTALDRQTGRELWTLAFPDYGGAPFIGAPSLYRNLLIVNVNGIQFALDRTTREVVWRYEARRTTAAIGSNAVYGDVVYFSGGDEHVHAVRASDGSFLWKAPFGGTLGRDLLVTEKRVYASNGGTLSIIDRRRGVRLLELSQPHVADAFSFFGSAAAYADGQVFVTVNGAAWSFDEP